MATSGGLATNAWIYGYDPDTASYDMSSWHYESLAGQARAGGAARCGPAIGRAVAAEGGHEREQHRGGDRLELGHDEQLRARARALGLQRIGHFGFFKQPALWGGMEEWMRERFPQAGLNQVCSKLLEVARSAKQRAAEFDRPIVWVRGVSGVVIHSSPTLAL